MFSPWAWGIFPPMAYNYKVYDSLKSQWLLRALCTSPCLLPVSIAAMYLYLTSSIIGVYWWLLPKYFFGHICILVCLVVITRAIMDNGEQWWDAIATVTMWNLAVSVQGIEWTKCFYFFIRSQSSIHHPSL